MSLKAKLEAVIYAAEEPVTLAQLAVLFADDVFAWKAEREAEQRELMLSVASGEEDAESCGPSDSLPDLRDMDEILEGMSHAEADSSGSVAPEAFAPARAGQEFEIVQAPELRVAVQEVSAEPKDPAADSVDRVLNPALDPAVEAKRLERAREREVREILRGVLDDLIAEYAEDSRGIEIREIAGGFRMGTKPETHDAVRAFVKSLKPPMKLSLPALETLAVIAYKQPVTAPEVNEIRGVDSSGVFGSLLARKLIATAGRKQVIGRPILYKTTKEFLLRFGLKDVTELPSMEEFEKMAQLEFDEMEPGTEENATSEAGEGSIPEVDDEPDEPIDDGSLTAEGKDAAEIREPAPEEPGAHTLDLRTTVAQAEPKSAEAAPAAPESAQEQAETETVPHG